MSNGSVLGLYSNRARWYVPKIGRFISTDPIGFAAGDANLYRYVFNSPTNDTDPNGLAPPNGGRPQIVPPDGQTTGIHHDSAKVGDPNKPDSDRGSGSTLSSGIKNYLWDSGKQIVLGDFNKSDPTVLGTVGETLGSFTGADILLDARDLTYSVTHPELSWGWAGNTALNVVGLFPVVGMVKSSKRVGQLLGRGSDSARAAKRFTKGAGNAGEAIGDALKRSNVPGGKAARLDIGPDADPQLARAIAPSTSGSTKPAWLQRLDEGNAFNKAQSPRYPHNEVYIDKAGGGYYRLDSYNPRTGEIVSRKLTQFGDIQESTGHGYLNELAGKYAPGSKIANVPSSGGLAGQRLQGQMILEVPVQTGPIPQSVLDAANNHGIIIRDVNGKVY